MTEKIHKKYSMEEVKTKFQYVKDMNEISDSEYNFFCEGLSVLTVDILESVKEGIYFSLLSVDPKPKRTFACFINNDDLNGKKSIICLTHLYFLLRPSESNFKISECLDINKEGFESRQFLLHEIAHFYLNHKDSDLKEKEKIEEEANELANKWLVGDFD